MLNLALTLAFSLDICFNGVCQYHIYIIKNGCHFQEMSITSKSARSQKQNPNLASIAQPQCSTQKWILETTNLKKKGSHNLP